MEAGVHGKHAACLPCLSASRSVGAGDWEGVRFVLVMMDTELRLSYFPSPSSILLFPNLKFALQLELPGSEIQQDLEKNTIIYSTLARTMTGKTKGINPWFSKNSHSNWQFKIGRHLEILQNRTITQE